MLTFTVFLKSVLKKGLSFEKFLFLSATSRAAQAIVAPFATMSDIPSLPRPSDNCVNAEVERAMACDA
jgi:hypothetical protein